MPDPQVSHVRCCWCGEPLRRTGPTAFWMCWTPACYQRACVWALTVAERRADGTIGDRVHSWLFAPTPRQTEFYEQTRRTKYTLFGGAKAVAKSYAARWGLYRDCLRFPGLRCLLLRRTFGELEATHLLDMPGEAETLKLVGATFAKSDREFRLGRGSLIKAGHCETEADVSKHLSTQWDRIVFDELVTFECDMALAIMSCARAVKPDVIADGGALVWGVTNPGGRGAHWIKEFFVEHVVDSERFPAYDPSVWGAVLGTVEDNPYMEPGYRKTLENLPPILRRQWLYGDWEAFEGQFFDFASQRGGQPWHVADLGLVA